MYRCDSYLKCQNAVPNGPRTCWNHLQVDYGQAHRKVISWIVEILGQYLDVRKVIVDQAWGELSRGSRQRQHSGSRIQMQIAEYEKEAKQLALAIRKGGELELLVAELTVVEADLQKAREQQSILLGQAENEGRFLSRERVDDELEQALLELVGRLHDFADLLRRLIPEFIIRPVQAFNTPYVRPQAQLTFSTEAWEQPGTRPIVTSATLDLFDAPVQIKHIARCVAARQAHPEESVRALGERLELNYNTVDRALIYAKLTEKEGISTPYRQLHTPPHNAPRWKKRAGGPLAESA